MSAYLTREEAEIYITPIMVSASLEYGATGPSLQTAGLDLFISGASDYIDAYIQGSKQVTLPLTTVPPIIKEMTAWKLTDTLFARASLMTPNHIQWKLVQNENFLIQFRDGKVTIPGLPVSNYAAQGGHVEGASPSEDAGYAYCDDGGGRVMTYQTLRKSFG